MIYILRTYCRLCEVLDFVLRILFISLYSFALLFDFATRGKIDYMFMKGFVL